jgi:threonine synthase
MWRCPVMPSKRPVTLGEGGTPLLEAPWLAKELGVRAVWIKEEGTNPTASFKARGMAAAVTMAAELGVERVCVPSAGNAGGACAAYAARAGIRARIYMPEETPAANVREVRAAGAELVQVPGTIADAAARMRQDPDAGFDLSTLKEPYRVEGKKTMAYEIVEQLGWRLPTALVFPTGGGTGILGMWKAFAEMAAMGWIRGTPPRMVVVQPEGCAPLVKAHAEGRLESEAWKDPRTVAAGLRVPKAFADWLVLQILRDSRGAAVAVREADILPAVDELCSRSGIFACPEGAACLPAARELGRAGALRKGDVVVLFNTGSGYKYL